jgi:hypothetical protein
MSPTTTLPASRFDSPPQAGRIVKETKNEKLLEPIRDWGYLKMTLGIGTWRRIQEHTCWLEDYSRV